MRPQNSAYSRCEIDALSEILSACGFNVRLYRGGRLYISGYGKDIKAYLHEGPILGPLPADGYALSVSSTWRAAQYNGLRCKGVKHAILEDLYTARLITAPPPRRWQDVELEAPHGARRAIQPYMPSMPRVSETDTLPARHPLDPYAALRAAHRSGKGA